MKNIHVVDANIILRYLLADHAEHHEIAKSFLIKVREGNCTAFFPESVIAECVYVMQRIYLIPRIEIAEKLSGILFFLGAKSNDHILLVRTLQVYAESKLSFVDALIATMAKEKNWSVQTFDKDLIILINR